MCTWNSSGENSRTVRLWYFLTEHLSVEIFFYFPWWYDYHTCKMYGFLLTQSLLCTVEFSLHHRIRSNTPATVSDLLQERVYMQGIYKRKIDCLYRLKVSLRFNTYNWENLLVQKENVYSLRRTWEIRAATRAAARHPRRPTTLHPGSCYGQGRRWESPSASLALQESSLFYLYYNDYSTLGELAGWPYTEGWWEVDGGH